MIIKYYYISMILIGSSLVTSHKVLQVTRKSYNLKGVTGKKYSSSTPRKKKRVFASRVKNIHIYFYTSQMSPDELSIQLKDAVKRSH